MDVVYIIEETKDNQEILSWLSVAGGYDCKTFDSNMDPDTAFNELPNPELIISDTSNIAIIPYLKQKFPKTKILLHLENPSNDLIDVVTSMNEINSIVASNSDSIKDKADLLISIKKLMTEEDIYGPDKLLGWGHKLHSFEVPDTKKRFELTDQLFNFARAIGIRRTIARYITEFADEFLLLSMSKENNPDNKNIKISWAFDGHKLAVSICEEPGFLTKKIALNYLRRFLGTDKEFYKVGDTIAPTIGLYKVISLFPKLEINMNKNGKTEIIAITNREITVRNTKEMQRLFSFVNK